jgi:hypothetical protein
MTQQLRLIAPSTAWQAAFLDMAAEFAANDDPRYQAACTDFAAYVARLQHFTGLNDPWACRHQRCAQGVSAPALIQDIELHVDWH